MSARSLGLSLAAFAAEPGRHDFGKYEYQAKCASCHGISGKGDGPAAKAMKKAPPDLTTYAKRNGGAFPTQLAWQVIDGWPIEGGAHGSREMPVWGQDFRRDVLKNPEPPAAPDWYVAGKDPGADRLPGQHPGQVRAIAGCAATPPGARSLDVDSASHCEAGSRLPTERRQQ